MITALKRFLADLAGEDRHQPVGEDEARLAAAALLFHVTAIDGVVADEERERLREMLKACFALDEPDTEELLAAAESADREAVDLFGFTSILKQRLDIGERESIVGMMWELVYADGRLHEFEDNLIWRAAELLGVASDVRMRLKRAARPDAGS